MNVPPFICGLMPFKRTQTTYNTWLLLQSNIPRAASFYLNVGAANDVVKRNFGREDQSGHGASRWQKRAVPTDWYRPKYHRWSRSSGRMGGTPPTTVVFLFLYFFSTLLPRLLGEDGGGSCSLILWLGPRPRRAEEGKRGGGNGGGGRTWHRGRALSDRCKKRQENVDGRSVDCCNHSEAGRSVSSVQKVSLHPSPASAQIVSFAQLCR